MPGQSPHLLDQQLSGWLAVMDMWKPFRNATAQAAPQAAILFDKFHIMRHLGEVLDEVRKSEYGGIVFMLPSALLRCALFPG